MKAREHPAEKSLKFLIIWKIITFRPFVLIFSFDVI